MVELIQNQWFPSSFRIKGDIDTTVCMVEEQTVPLSIIFLSLTVVCGLHLHFAGLNSLF
jgi:hypothetical protein